MTDPLENEQIIDDMARAAFRVVTGFGQYDFEDYKEKDTWPYTRLSVEAETFRECAKAALAAYLKSVAR